MASPSSHSTPTSSSRSWKYHVFLSFRGGDTRRNFVDHLFSALEKSLINVYKDDVTLPRGETIGPSLFKAIEESQIAVVVFSKNYADSSWCLDELSHIMDERARGLIVMPIFYDVDPSDVRKRKREFGEAFAKQEANNINKAESWRKALVDASNIAGWEPKNFADGHEAKLIAEIVDTILKISKLPYSSSDVDKGLVGMRDRVYELISQLKIGSSGVSMVGIWGVGGGGKTTLATSVYKAISSQFKGHCFVEDIQDKSNKKSLVKLQIKMLSGVLGRPMEVATVDKGKETIATHLCGSNVLVVLDNVNSLEQLDALAGSKAWFGSGSRIIITTRYLHLLQKVDHVSPVILLSNYEAVSLFNKHAYNEENRIKDYGMLSSRAVSYAAGLPLALKVVGSFLYDKNNDEWISYLDKLKSFPDREVMNILMTSYEGLEDNQKELFLDIACFLRGEVKRYFMDTLDAFGFHPVIGIKVLQQKALITIVDGKFDMHDLIQEMGHHIVRGKYPNNPEKHKGLVGMRVRVYELISQLQIGSCGVIMVGIWGVAGGGKTTLATSVYKGLSSQFKCHCFVEDIPEESKKKEKVTNKKSLVKLQNRMLSGVLGRKMEVPTVDEGKETIATHLCGSNVLVVLDNVNSLEQLDALAGSKAWFGSGSRIIITTRYLHLLQRVDVACPVKL